MFSMQPHHLKKPADSEGKKGSKGNKKRKITSEVKQTGAPYLATDWMTLEDVSLMLVRKRSVPPFKISKKPLPGWSGS